MQNICNVSVWYPNAPADIRHLLVCGPQFDKTGLENLEQLLYLCIFWFRIWITASNYQLYTFLNIWLSHFIHRGVILHNAW